MSVRPSIHWPSIHWTALLFLCSCQAYTIPDRATSVTVQTIALPPQWAGMEAELTRELVQELRTMGYDTEWASTTSESDRKRVRCTVDLKATHMPHALIMDAVLSCDVASASIQERGQSSVFAEDSRAAFDASKNALTRALPNIDHALQVSQ